MSTCPVSPPPCPEVDDFVELWDEPAELTRSDNIWALQELVPPPPVAATNATAQRIYARLGYTRVCESRQYAFA